MMTQQPLDLFILLSMIQYSNSISIEDENTTRSPKIRSKILFPLIMAEISLTFSLLSLYQSKITLIKKSHPP